MAHMDSGRYGLLLVVGKDFELLMMNNCGTDRQIGMGGEYEETLYHRWNYGRWKDNCMSEIKDRII
jgi:hypothetical protein